MRFALLILCLCSAGCHTTQQAVRHYAPPSTVPIRQSVAKASSAVVQSRTGIAKASTGIQAVRDEVRVIIGELPPELKPKVEGVTLQLETAIVDLRAADESAGTAQKSLAQSVQDVAVLEAKGAELAEAATKNAEQAKYWETKHSEAVKKLWWWRLWAGGAIALGVALIAGGLLLRFTNWGARTIGPLVTKAAAF